MDALLPHETALTGKWIETHDGIRGDVTCDRIARLTDGVLDVVQDHPKSGGWVRLFRDVGDGRYWERSYPQSEMHGGGPPALRWIGDEELAREYDFH